MEWHFIIIMYLNMFFWRFLINHSMFLIFNDTGRTAFKFGRFEYFFVFLRPVFWEISKWRYIKMLLYYSRLFVWYIKYFKCLFQHYDVIQQHCEVTQPHSSIPPAVHYYIWYMVIWYKVIKYYVMLCYGTWYMVDLMVHGRLNGAQRLHEPVLP